MSQKRPSKTAEEMATATLERLRQGPAQARIAESVGRAIADRWTLMRSRAELLEVLETLVRRVEHYAPQMAREGDLDEARAAIAKARGE